jgi:hypothetical protein
VSVHIVLLCEHRNGTPSRCWWRSETATLEGVPPHVATPRCGVPKLGTFNEQVWGDSDERRQIGSSFGGSIAGTESAFPDMAVARYYYPGTPSVWGGAIATLPADQVIFVSFNYGVAATAAGGSDAAFTQVLRSWAASARQIYWTWQHEPDDPTKGINQAAYLAGWSHLLADAAAVYAPNLHSMSILEGIALTGVHGPIDSWYVPGVDVLGFDCYYLSSERLAEQYAAAHGKPLAIPEFGDGIGGSPDSASAAFAGQFISGLGSNTIAAVWFNNYGNTLSNRPQTPAVLKASAS